MGPWWYWWLQFTHEWVGQLNWALPIYIVWGIGCNNITTKYKPTWIKAENEWAYPQVLSHVSTTTTTFKTATFLIFIFFSYLRKWRFIIELQNKLIIVKLVHYYFISWNISSVILDGPCALLPTLKPIIWLLEPAHQNGVQPTI